jgi:deoxyadenosine/deoxycytidine kinase
MPKRKKMSADTPKYAPLAITPVDDHGDHVVSRLQTGNVFDDFINPPFIGIAGLIGSGKTELTKNLSKRLDIPAYFEPVINYTLLEQFYGNMSRYGFQLQIDLLSNRFKQQQQIVWDERGGISDRTIYEDAIFARVLVKGGHMEQSEYATYIKLFSRMANLMRRPTLIVYLRVTPEQSMERIIGRGREMEHGITIEYLRQLYEEYELFIQQISHSTPVLIVDWSDYTAVDSLIAAINKKLNCPRDITVVPRSKSM